MFKSLSARVLAALLLGLLLGILIHGAAPQVAVDKPDLASQLVAAIVALGGLWLNVLKMTVVPLVFSLLVTGIASVADAMATGRLAVRAVLLFTVLLIGAALYGIAATMGALALWPVGPAETHALLANVHPLPPPPARSFGDWLQSIAPANVLQAAGDNSNITPLVTFAILLGFAATRMPQNLREPIVALFTALGEAMIVIVQWAMVVAPVGVLALSLGVGLNGLSAAVGVGQYIVIVSVVTAISVPIAFFMAMIWGKIPMGKLAEAMAPVWAIAFSTRSSLASLPAMLDTARRKLSIPDRVADLVLPLAVAVFRFTSPIANLAVCFFIAHIYHLHPNASQIATSVFVAFAMSVGSVGLPGEVSYIASIAPICFALGLPIEPLAIFLGVEAIPDIFRTLGNVQGDIAATAIVNRGERAVMAAPAKATA